MGAAPNWLRCSKASQHIHDGRGELPIVRTGRTKPNPSNNRPLRSMGVMQEVRCACGHQWFTTHIDSLRKPLADES